MTDALYYYTNLTGLRAILWHQGETDNYLNTSFESYVSDFSNLLNATKSQTGKDISWVVARASKDPNRYYQTVIDAQNYVIQSHGNVFEGPNTDAVQERTDDVHFSNVGFTKVATGWNESINDNFLAQSTPQFGNPPLQISDPLGTQPLRLYAPLVSYKWNNTGSKREIQIGPGLYQGKAKVTYGNVYYSAPIKFDNGLFSTKPNIEALGKTEICAGQSVQLKTNNNFWNYWSNGSEGEYLTVNQGGKYHITHGNIYAYSAKSDEIEVKETPKPIIKASGPLGIYSDETLILSTNQDKNIQWNTGSIEPNLTINQAGIYTLKATNEEGCVGESDPLIISIKPAAIIPEIENLGEKEICDLDSTILKAGNLQNMKWMNGDLQQEIVVKTGGEYYAINENEFGCKSLSNKIQKLFNPYPLNQPLLRKPVQLYARMK